MFSGLRSVCMRLRSCRTVIVESDGVEERRKGRGGKNQQTKRKKDLQATLVKS